MFTARWHVWSSRQWENVPFGSMLHLSSQLAIVKDSAHTKQPHKHSVSRHQESRGAVQTAQDQK
jgi:hypothetical protein